MTNITTNVYREALSEAKKEIEILRYNLWMCRKNAYQSFMATSGVLPDGYESRMEEQERQELKKGKKL